MIEELGEVVAVHGDLAEVRGRRPSLCGSCAAAGACGTSLLDRFFARRPVLTVYNSVGAGPGDSVVVGFPEQALLAASFATYLVPLLGMIAGAMGAAYLSEQVLPDSVRGLSVLGGAGGLAAGLGWLGRFSRARERDERYRAVILRRGVAAGLAMPVSPQSSAAKQ